MIEVYWISGSPYCWSVLLLLEVKGIEYTSILLSADKQEHKSPNFLKLNPRGSVPVIRDGDHSVRETLAILMYLESRFPSKPLFGSEALEIAKIWQSISEFNSYLLDPMYQIASLIFRKNAFQQRQKFMQRVEELLPEFTYLENHLNENRYLANDVISAADLIAFPRFIHFLLAITEVEFESLTGLFLPFKTQYPAISNWLERIERVPGYQQTFPPHWKKIMVSDC